MMYPTEAQAFDAFHPRINWARLRLLAAVGLVALNVFDAALTQELLRTGGGVEANPLMRPIAHTDWMWVVKIGLPIWLGWVHVSRPVDRRQIVGLVVVALAYCGVVLWNTHLLGVS